MSEAYELADSLHLATTHRDHEELHGQHLARIAELEAVIAAHEQRMAEHLSAYHAPEPEPEPVVEEEAERIEEAIEEVPEAEPPKVEADVLPRTSHWALRRYGRSEE